MPPNQRNPSKASRRSQNEAIIEKLTNSMVSVEGQATRPITWH